MTRRKALVVLAAVALAIGAFFVGRASVDEDAAYEQGQADLMERLITPGAPKGDSDHPGLNAVPEPPPPGGPAPWADAAMPPPPAESVNESNSAPERVRLKRCHVKVGGYNVRIANVRCNEVAQILPQWGPRSVHEEADRPQGVFLEDGWQCWARLEKEGGPILNVCMRGDAVITYKFG